MDFEIYADESGLDALTNKGAHTFCAIGGIWIPTKQRVLFKKSIGEIKAKYKIAGELKWQKVSPAYFHLYKDLLDYFFNTDFIRFRVVLIESSLLDHVKFNNKDPELGFYKFYYQLLHHWILDFNSYDIFLDHKINRSKTRLKDLKGALCNANLTSNIEQVQALPSNQSVGIQLADVLTGMVATKMNKGAAGAKIELINHIEETYLKKEIAPSPKWEEKLNVFKINLKGGW